MRTARIAVIALSLAAMADGVATAAWTPVTSGVTSDITGIEYQSATRFWFITSDGGIYNRAAGGFTAAVSPDGFALRDIEVRGQIGLAVGAVKSPAAGAKLLRSRDGGFTWQELPGATAVASGGDTCTAYKPLVESRSVRFAADDVAVVMGNSQSQVLKITNLAADSPTYTSVNEVAPGPGCKIAFGVGDGFWPTPTTGYFIGANTGLYATSDQYGSVTTLPGGSQGAPEMKIAGDPANPARQWLARSRIMRTTDAWSTAPRAPQYVPSVPPEAVIPSIAYRDGTVLAAGRPGVVYGSRDGETFHRHALDGPLATADLRDVSLATKSDGAVGGAGGVLAVTTAADAVPATSTPQQPQPQPQPPAAVKRPAVTPPPAIYGGRTKAVRVANRVGRFVITVPRDCVHPGQRFRIAVRWTRTSSRSRVTRIHRVDFSRGARRVKVDRTAPFAALVRLPVLLHGGRSTLTLRAHTMTRRGAGPQSVLRTGVRACM